MLSSCSNIKQNCQGKYERCRCAAFSSLTRFIFIYLWFCPSQLLHPLKLPLLLQLALQATILISSHLLASSGLHRLSYSLLFLCRYKLALLKRFPGQVLTPSGAQPHKHTRYLSNERKAVKLQGNLSDLSETAPRSEGRGAETDNPNCHRIFSLPSSPVCSRNPEILRLPDKSANAGSLSELEIGPRSPDITQPYLSTKQGFLSLQIPVQTPFRKSFIEVLFIANSWMIKRGHYKSCLFPTLAGIGGAEM